LGCFGHLALYLLLNKKQIKVTGCSLTGVQTTDKGMLG